MFSEHTTQALQREWVKLSFRALLPRVTTFSSLFLTEPNLQSPLLKLSTIYAAWANTSPTSLVQSTNCPRSLSPPTSRQEDARPSRQANVEVGSILPNLRHEIHHVWCFNLCLL
jgi:hypothetical protein